MRLMRPDVFLAGQLAKAFEEIPVERVDILLHGLQPPGAVHVRYRRQTITQLLPHRHDVEHVSRRMMTLGLR